MATQSLVNDLEEWKIVDESLGMDLPDNDEPDMYQPPIPPPPPSSPPIPMSELVASIEAQAKRAGAAARRHLLGPEYAHLPNVQLDWSLVGRDICRVVGMTCHGKRLGSGHLRRHKYNDKLPAAQTEPASSLSAAKPPTPVAPAPEMVTPVELMDVESGILAERAINTTHSAREKGDGKSGGKATKRPRLALGATIPDSEVYLRTSRQIRLLDLEAKSPLYTHFTDTIKGVATIRAFGWQQFDIAHSNKLLDTSQRPAYLLAMIQQWLATLLHFIVTGTAVLLIALATQLRTNAGLTGASLISLLTFSEALSNLITSYTSLETSLGAVSRLRSFSETVETENKPGEVIKPPETWPQSGSIQIQKVSASYESPNSEQQEASSSLALCDLELDILPGQKVAICGRTGSGKSTLILLLLRLIDPLPSCDSNMKIDDIYLHQIDRATLRKRVICIPQDAVFLPDGSSVKDNIDPYKAATDAECFNVLNTVRLAGFVQDKGSLNAGMSADDLSAGQKQLFSLGRAILRRRVRDRFAGGEKRGGLLLLDEVSSSVDKVTDRAMQEIIREEFENYTIVMVSHRLEMVMDFFDRVIVLDRGTVVESGGPRELVETPGSRFGDLWAVEHDGRSE
ncbi:multidrug resistance [Fusarium tjaetaba]|uniref:Multidrug resistance n=1 Tax=Fusarium tjaetaba TaxID=1567544 RepID=A0A8H5S0A6_9HYPO|nr:multidrug resistance [Fusarium tjaetaba]KAF5644186.1 multidrug resistance [Fusarium tjaetaba]